MALVLPEESAPQDGKKILPRAVWTLKALRALNLSQNAFKSCPLGLSQLTNLQFLDVSGCKEMQVGLPAVHALRCMTQSSTRRMLVFHLSVVVAGYLRASRAPVTAFSGC